MLLWATQPNKGYGKDSVRGVLGIDTQKEGKISFSALIGHHFEAEWKMLFCMLFPSLRGGKVLLMVYSQGC
jgi:hypothetical protein